MSLVTVRSLQTPDKAAWRKLWDAYLVFYESELSEAQTALTWQRLLDTNYNLHGMVAELGERIVGITHYLFHGSTWAEQSYCYLEDLFVAPDVRASGVGRALIKSVEAAAHAQGAAKLYWLTKETNYKGRALYDKVAERSGFIHYSMGFNASVD